MYIAMSRTNKVLAQSRFFISITMMLLLSLAASARDKISVSYAKGFNLSQYKTYA